MTNTEYINHILESLETPLWGKWELKDLISTSTDSAVYGMQSRRMNRTESAVLKIVPLTASKAYFTEEQKQAQIEKAKRHAEQESDLLYRLQSCPTIVSYQDEELKEIIVNGQFEGYAYLIRTEKLTLLAESIRRKQFICNEEQVLRLAKEITLALQFAHGQGIMHRNIQPDKIFISSAGTAKLGGFRPAKRSGAIRAFSDSDAYIAPEIFSAKRAAEFTPQADLYSLGICLYQLMNAMYLPFEDAYDSDEAWEMRMNGEPLPNPVNASEAFSRIILKACAFAPEDRFRSADDLLAALFFPEQAMQLMQEPSVKQTETEPTAAVPEQSPVQVEADPDTETPVSNIEPAVTETEIQTVPEEVPETPELEMPSVPVIEPLTDQAEADEYAQPEIPEEETAAAEDTESEPVPASDDKDSELEMPSVTVADAIEEQTEAAGTAQPYLNEDEPVPSYSEEHEAVEDEPELSEAADPVPEEVPERIIPAAAESELEDEAELQPEDTEQPEIAEEEPDIESSSDIEQESVPETAELAETPEPETPADQVEPETPPAPKSKPEKKNKEPQESTGFIIHIPDESIIQHVPFKPLKEEAEDTEEVPSESDTEIAENAEPEEEIEDVETGPFVIHGEKLVKYHGDEKTVTIPEGITVIGKSAFHHCGTVEQIILPEGVVRIEETAFADCQYLEQVQFPSTLKIVFNKAFMNCISLLSVEFSGALSQIGSNAFEGCQSLQSVSIDSPIEKIGFDAFLGCISLQKIDVTKQSFSYRSIDGVLFDKDCKQLVRYPAGKRYPDYVIPDKVSAIGDGAFYGSAALERVKLSKNVKKIGASAFRNCSKLWEVILSENLESIKSAAFQGCSSLNKIKLPPYITHIGTYAFSHCDQLRSINLPNNLTEICMGAFEYCRHLTIIRLPESIYKIGEKAFMHSGLTEVFIPYSTTKMEKYAFAFCKRLQNIFMSNRITQITLSAFEGCNRTMTIFGMMNSEPEEFAKSHQFQFRQMFKLGTISGQSALEEYLGEFSFVVIPPDVNIIGDKAFYNCKTIRAVEISSNVGEIGKSAFEYCENLESISMTNLIMRIGEHAFDNCKSLKQIQITDMSQKFSPKVQRKVHQNFYKVLQSVSPESANDYAMQYDFPLKTPMFEMPFPRQSKKPSKDYIARLAKIYESSPFANALLDKIKEEMDKSERRLIQIEVFGDSIMTTGVKAGKTAKQSFFYKDLNVGIHTLPDVNHMLACATVIVKALGSDFCLSPVQNKDSAMIRPSIS